MADPAPSLDPATRAALNKLADIAVPPEVSLAPQTWGWVALLMVVVALFVFALLRWRRKHEANRYRREALAELDHIESQFGEEAGYAEAVTALPALLKRVALAAWPRSDVASLSGAGWVAFLRLNTGGKVLPDEAAKVLDDMEYRSHTEIPMTADEARAFAKAVRGWIEGHRVPA